MATLRTSLVSTLATVLVVSLIGVAPARQDQKPAAATAAADIDPRDGWRPNSEKDRDDWADDVEAGPDISLDRSVGSKGASGAGAWKVAGIADGLTLNASRLLRANGADLSWTPYTGDDLLEYQVHRGTEKDFKPSAATLVAPLSPDTHRFSDRAAPPARSGDGRTYHYLIAARTKDGRLLTSPDRSFELPVVGSLLKALGGQDDQDGQDDRDNLEGQDGAGSGRDDGTQLIRAADKSATYSLPYTPTRAIPGHRYTVEATLTNTTDEVWKADRRMLSYRWHLEGHDVSNLFNQKATKLPKDLAPGESATFKATLQVPKLANLLASRVEYELQWDLRDKLTKRWLSETDDVPPSKHDVVVEKPTSNELGLEQFHSYAGRNTGANSTLMGNLHSGNAVWSYNAFNNPSRGFSTSARLAYNSQDFSSSPAGRGWSLQLGSPLRLGTPLHFSPAGLLPLKVHMTDGDGTTHVFRKDKKSHTWRAPAGVNMRLTQLHKPCLPLLSREREAWELLRPDRTRFLFDCQGYPTAMVDKNGNRMEFTYEEGLLGKKLKHITDAAGRRTLTVDYWETLKDYRWIDKDGEVRDGKLLLNPLIIGKVKSVTDVSGRKMELTYNQKGRLGRLEDGAGSEQPKVFRFGYGHAWGLPISKLDSVTDPRGNTTKLDYVSPHDDGQLRYKGDLKEITDRRGNPTRFAYDDPDGLKGSSIRSEVRDAEGHSTQQLLDGYGRPTEITDAKKQTTKLGWDAENNVTRLEEPNGAVSTWKYDQKTGYPLEIRDAEAVERDRPAAKLAYAKGEDGYIADLSERISPEGRKWRFGYDDRGNLTSVTDPKGVESDEDGDYTTTYAYDDLGQLTRATDPNGHATTYGDYSPVGYPGTETDALGNRTVTTYDERGNVTALQEANGAETTQTYDVFGRPLENRAPKDQDAGEYITTPAPEYDANDNTVRFTAPNRASTTSTYDAADQLTSEVAPKDDADADERKTTYTYDKVGNQLTKTDPKGNLTEDPDDYTTRTSYDENNQPVAVTDAAGNRTTMAYDSVGNQIRTTDPLKNESADPDDYTSKYTYDLNGQLTKSTDVAGNSTGTTYDWDGLATVTTDADGNRTEQVLDARGALAESRVPHTKDITNVTRYEYDEAGNQTKEITPRGVATPGDPDDFTAETVYDELNRVKETRTAYDPDNSRYDSPDSTFYSYDEVGNVSRVSAPPSSGQDDRNVTRYSYFDNGWTKSSTDAYDIRNSYEYNNLGQQTQNTLTSAGGSVSRTMDTAYYPSGAMKSRSDDGVPVGKDAVLVDNSDINNTSRKGTWDTGKSSGAYGPDTHTHARGDGDARFAWQLNIPRGGKYEVYVRYPKVDDAATNASYEIKHKDGETRKRVDQTENPGAWRSLGAYDFTENGAQALTLTDDADGTVAADAVRLVRDNSGETDREAKDFGYRYDANGNQTEVTDRSPGADVDRYTMAYDGVNQLTKVQEHDGGSVRNTTSLTYDANGNTLTTEHDLTWSKLEYDALDRVQKITNADSPDAGDKQVTEVDYTARGELARQKKPNGNIATYSYYLDGPTRQQREEQSGGELVASHSLEYNRNGHKTQDKVRIRNADGGGTKDNTYAYSYDPQDRISKVEKTGDSASTESFVHDAAGNVTSQTADGLTTTHRYDRNRLLTSSAGGVSTSYNYDPLGRLDTTSSGGEVTQKQRYDGFDRTASTTTGTGAAKKTKTFSYDPFDRTTRERTSGNESKTTAFTYLGITSKSVRETVTGEGADSTSSFQYAPWGQKLTQIKDKEGEAEETAQYLYHPHGDVEGLTKPNGDTKTTYGYTAYGKNDKEQFSGIDKPDEDGEEKEDPYNAYRYNSMRYDTSSGSYDMGFRNYDPGLNRFLTRDMYGGALADLSLTTDPYTGNRYAFAGGNPVSFVEIDGHLFGLSWSDVGHATLDVAGLVPGFGEAADLANCAWYGAEGNATDAALSCASAVPFAGYAASAAKGAKYGSKAVDAANTAKKTDKAADAGDAGRKGGDGGNGSGGNRGGDGGSTGGGNRGGDSGTSGGGNKGGGNKGGGDSGGTKGGDTAPAPSTAQKAPEAPPNSGATCRVPNSFVPGTKVLMADGSTKPIEDVKAGDKVAASDVETNDAQTRTVTRTIEGDGTKHLVKITVDTDGRAGGKTSTLTATEGHPFWLPDVGRWVEAGDLERGQWLSTGSGSWIQVTAVEARTTKATVHNLTVAGAHTYRVLAGATPLLVHNCGSGPTSDLPTGDLVQEVARRADARIASTGNRAVDGSRKHKYAEKILGRYQNIFDNRGLQLEQSWLGGAPVPHGTPGSARPDVFDPSSGIAYDYKFTRNPPGISRGQWDKNALNVPGLSLTIPVVP
ncbi:polymorphic toxin-type HINT domain-containing protein [Streptomyces sp. NL15-2K]|uniref:golvesin C-terminal-like domain-containing protein n=1 Tax=Streptomyces sp. NL15-2K TaxID=376149 RepID=UPI000F58548B|nr:MULTISPECIES: polymorphic toxin-type HINT domain-containing protein [Actinomycetes]WKX13578.1 polymorphic toxin-type HINT domain-containing protein [Kutzneria buriramensis]